MGRKHTENVQDRPQSKVDNYWERKNLVRKNTSIEDFLISPQTGVLFLGLSVEKLSFRKLVSGSKVAGDC